MAEHTYKPGDVIAIRDVISQAVSPDERRYTDREWETRGGHLLYPPECARWMSNEDQDALLRVVRAAKTAEAALLKCVTAAMTVQPKLLQPYSDDVRWTPWSRWLEKPTVHADEVATELRAALSSLPDHLRARLEEEEL